MHKTWADDFWSFAEGIGDAPSDLHELDRIDNDGDYEPCNVRWVFRTANQRNQRRSCSVVVEGKKIPLVVVASIFSLDYFCLHVAYRRGNENLLRYLSKKGVSEGDIVAATIGEDYYAPEAPAALIG